MTESYCQHCEQPHGSESEANQLRAEVSRLTGELGLQQIHYNERLAEVKQQAHQRGKEEGAIGLLNLMVESGYYGPKLRDYWANKWREHEQKREGK